MATLTKSTGTVTLSGAVEKVSLPAVYGWVWVKNMSDSDMFVGLDDGVSAGADGVLAISAGECGRIQTDGFNSVYLMGTGNALVVAQNYADCPFKTVAKGGEAPDLSAYAKTADVPNIKVNSAVNADTVNSKKVEMATYTNLSSFGVSGTDTADTIWQAIPDGSIYVDRVQNLTDTSWNFPSGVSNEYTLFVAKMSKHRIGGMYLYPKTGGNIFWANVNSDGSYSGNWKKIQNEIKSATITASTDASGLITLPNNSTREYISIITSNCIALPFDSSSGARRFIAVDSDLAKKPNTSITFTAYYYDK